MKCILVMEDNIKLGKRTLITLIVVFFLLAGLVVSTTTFLGLKNYSTEHSSLAPDLLPPPEKRVEIIAESKDANRSTPSKGASVNLTFSDRVFIDLSKNEASFLFSSPIRSNQGIVLQLIIQDYIIFQTDAILPGSTLKHMPLLDFATLQPGGYEGKLVATFYDLTTREKAPVNAEIPVTISVTQ